jgi:pimeloyl-ACP methyl ester carboxylesterase
LPYSAMYRLFSYLLMPYKRNQLARKVYQQQAEIITQLAYMKWLGLYAEFFKLLKNFSTQSLSNEVLVVMGSDDYVFLNSAKRFVTNQPKAKLKILPKVGHICNIEAPHDFNELALDFLTNQK